MSWWCINFSKAQVKWINNLWFIHSSPQNIIYPFWYLNEEGPGNVFIPEGTQWYSPCLLNIDTPLPPTSNLPWSQQYFRSLRRLPSWYSCINWSYFYQTPGKYVFTPHYFCRNCNFTTHVKISLINRNTTSREFFSFSLFVLYVLIYFIRIKNILFYM